MTPSLPKLDGTSATVARAEATLAEATELLLTVRGLPTELQEEMELLRQVPEIAEQVRELHAAVTHAG